MPPEKRDRVFSLELIRIKWTEVVGSELARRTEPASVGGGVLTIRVSEAVWGRTILKMQRDILNRIGSVVGLRVIQRIQFIRDGQSLWINKPEMPKSNTYKSPPSMELPMSFVEAAEDLPDSTLRSLLMRTVSRYLAAQADRMK